MSKGIKTQLLSVFIYWFLMPFQLFQNSCPVLLPSVITSGIDLYFCRNTKRGRLFRTHWGWLKYFSGTQTWCTHGSDCIFLKVRHYNVPRIFLQFTQIICDSLHLKLISYFINSCNGLVPTDNDSLLGLIVTDSMTSYCGVLKFWFNANLSNFGFSYVVHFIW